MTKKITLILCILCILVGILATFSAHISHSTPLEQKWNTFVSEKYGIRFKYPSYLVFHDNDGDLNFKECDECPSSINIGSTSTPVSQAKLSIDNVTHPYYQITEELSKDDWNAVIVMPRSEESMIGDERRILIVRKNRLYTVNIRLADKDVHTFLENWIFL